MRILTLISLSLLLLASCESKRTIYNSSGEEVKERSKDITLEERFGGSFDVKKNKQGVPEASSQKVSSFQGSIDATRAVGASESGKQFGGRADISELREKNYGARATEYGGTKSYSDSTKSATTADSVPAFMKPGKGIERQDYSAASKHVVDAEASYDAGAAYEKTVSRTNRDQTSNYFEGRRERTEQPVIISRDEYVRKTMEETRGMLGRDQNQRLGNSD